MTTRRVALNDNLGNQCACRMGQWTPLRGFVGTVDRSSRHRGIRGPARNVGHHNTPIEKLQNFQLPLIVLLLFPHKWLNHWTQERRNHNDCERD